MRAMGRVARALPVLLALFVLVPGAARAGDVTKQEVEGYVGEIGDEHSALGEAIVLLGRMIQVSLRDPNAVDTPSYGEAISRVEELIEAIGGADALEGRLASLKAEIREVHQIFIGCVAALERSNGIMDEASYYYSSVAHEEWKQSRQSFIDFTETLEALKAEYDIAS